MRTSRDQHQRLQRAAAGVYEELRAVLEVVPPALNFSGKELAAMLLMSKAERQKVVDALPDSPGDNEVVRLDPEPAA